MFLLRRERRPPFYELYDGQVRLGSMRFAYTRERSVVAASPHGGWEMHRSGFFQTRLPVLAPGGAREIGWVRRRIWWGGFDLELNGERYSFGLTSFWRRWWTLTPAGGEPLHLTLSRSLARELRGDAGVPVPAILLACRLMVLPMRSKPRGIAVGARRPDA